MAWKPPKSDGGSPVTGYQVEKRLSRKGSEWTKASPVETEKCNMKVTNLDEGKEYEFRVVAINEVGLGKPSSATKKLLVRDPIDAASPPTDVNVDKIKKNAVTLSWNKPRSDGGSKIKNYIVEKKNPDGEWVPVKTVPPNDKVTTVPVTEGEQCQFRVLAENELGPGEPSRPTAMLTAATQSEKPKLDLSALQDLVLKAGQDMVLKIPYSGFPKPELLVEKNGDDYNPTEDGTVQVSSV